MTEYTPETPLADVELPWDRDAIVRDVIASDEATTFTVSEPRTLADDVKAHAVKLATLRTELAAREAAVKAARKGFEDTIATQLQTIEGLRRELEAEEGTVRAFAKLAYDQTGDTKPCPGITVVRAKEYEIDEAAGLAWAKTTRMCLVPERLDVAAVKKMASVTELPFVTVTERPTVRIATDLLKALGGEGA